VPQQAAAANAARQAAAYDAANEANKVAADFQAAVQRANNAIWQRNARITAVLRPVTGVDLGDEPMKWWKWWWQDYNEMYSVSSRGEVPPPDQPAKPVYTYSYNSSTIDSRSFDAAIPCSCFAPGTKVWTLTGQRPIEKIKIGDRVLAQDVESGELAYKPVLATTIRQPGPRMRIGLGKETITTTPSHPFWVAGQGWRMTKQLKVGDLLHTTSGGVPVESVEKLEADPSPAGLAYNLIVADYSSYFVGQRAILVHDNTPRMPTAALLPGLVRQEAGQ
jgi:hypothetical protein